MSMRGLTATSFLAVLLFAYASADASERYFRFGFGLERAAGTIFSDVDCTSASPQPAALYGCGTGPDGAPLRTVGDFGSDVAFEFGVGWRLKPNLRLETQLEFRPNLAFQGNANFLASERLQSVTADLSTFTGMLALYSDLPSFGTQKNRSLTPFVGAGIGAARTKIGETHMMFPVTTTIVPGASRTDLAWMITAGVATAIDERTTLEFAWRYADLGEVRTGVGPGQVVWRDGSRDPRPLNLAATRAKLRSHGLRISMRHSY